MPKKRRAASRKRGGGATPPTPPAPPTDDGAAPNIRGPQRSVERFTCTFQRDFRGIGISLDVDDHGRLMVEEVDEDGEAGGVVDVRQATGLQIVAVGVATRKKERPADELLRQLITLPRPVNVEFARTINNATSSDHQGAKASAGRDNERSSASSKRYDEAAGVRKAASAIPADRVSSVQPATRRSSSDITTLEEAAAALKEQPPPNHHGSAQSRDGDSDGTFLTSSRLCKLAQASSGASLKQTSEISHRRRNSGDTAGQTSAVGDLNDHNVTEGVNVAGPFAEEGGQRQRGAGEDGSKNEEPCEDALRPALPPPPPPQRHEALAAGASWEESLRRGTARRTTGKEKAEMVIKTTLHGRSSQESSTDIVRSRPDIAGGIPDDESSSHVDDAEGSGRVIKGPKGLSIEGLGLMMTRNGSESSTRSQANSEGPESIRRWIQDDSDDSDKEAEKTSPRHSWYTANITRGGHAPDVNHATPFARAAALARARENDRTAACVDGATAPIAAASTAMAAETTRDRGRLPNAVTARNHRSPSYKATKRRTGVEVGRNGEEDENAGKSSFRQRELDAGFVGGRGGQARGPQQVEVTSVSSARDGSVQQHAAAAAAVGNEASVKAVGGVPRSGGKAIGGPRKGGVSAREHRPPSQVFRGGATLLEGGQDAAAKAAASTVAKAAQLLAVTTRAASELAISSATTPSKERMSSKVVGVSQSSSLSSTAEKGSEHNDSLSLIKVTNDTTGNRQEDVDGEAGGVAALSRRNAGARSRNDSSGSTIASLIENHRPFAKRSESKSRHFSDNQTAHLGRDATATVTVEISNGPSHNLSATPSTSQSRTQRAAGSKTPAAARCPSVGPVNPRLMYGHVGTLPAREISGQSQPVRGRRPSSVVLPSPEPQPKGEMEGGGNDAIANVLSSQGLLRRTSTTGSEDNRSVAEIAEARAIGGRDGRIGAESPGRAERGMRKAASTRASSRRYIDEGHDDKVNDDDRKDEIGNDDGALGVPARMSWEEQLRAMADVNTGHGARATQSSTKAALSKDKGGRGGGGRGKRAGASEPPILQKPAKTAWNQLHVDVNHDRAMLSPERNTSQCAADADERPYPGSVGYRTVAAKPSDAAVCGRSNTRCLDGSVAGRGGNLKRGERSSHAPSSTSQATGAAAAAAAAPPAAATVGGISEGWRKKKGRVTTIDTIKLSSASAAEAVMSGPVTPGVGGIVDGGGVRREGKREVKPHIARVRATVRSSVYVIVVDLAKDGAMLLDEVQEAERQRHGGRAATVTALSNEMTGDVIDVDVPAERSVSSGDCLTAILSSQAPATRAVGSCTVKAESSDGGKSEEAFTSTGAEAGGSSYVGSNTRGNAGSLSTVNPSAVRGAAVKGELERDDRRTSPQRCRTGANNGSTPRRGRGDGSGSGGVSPVRSAADGEPVDTIEQLRDRVALHLVRERQAAGDGVSAFALPTRPMGSPALTYLTAGGRGASPENSRPTSPRSASPRGAPKGPGRQPPSPSSPSAARAAAAVLAAAAGGRDTKGGGMRPPSPARSAHSATSNYTQQSGFSAQSRAARSEAAFLAQTALTQEELDGILKEELVKSRKWSARNRDAHDKFRRVWEERGSDYARLQQSYEAAEAVWQEKARRRREMEAEQTNARNRQRLARAESALRQAKSSRGGRESRAKEAEAGHRKRMQKIADRRDKEHRQHATKVQMMDRRREDVRDSFLDMVDRENETAIQALETPLETLNRALRTGDEALEKKSRRAILKQTARERVHVRERAARVLAEQRRLEKKADASIRTRQEIESSMMPGPGQYNLRDFSEYGKGTYSRPLV